MATPAARTLQKRYTAGSCTLDVALQLSALSQWYPQPIAQDLQFQLWLNNLDTSPETQPNTQPNTQLVAQGDRAALQDLSQAVSQKVRGLLAIAHLNNPNANRSRSSELPLSQPLPGLQLTHPLSYLQLCDLSSVLYQCEQSTPALPVSLSVSPAAEASRLEAVPSDRISTTPTRETGAPRRNNVIPFAAIRRRPQLWASSAAAALVAVGLTTTLWPSLQNSSAPSTTASSETAPDNARPNTVNPDTARPDTDSRLTLPKTSPRNPENSDSAAEDSIARAPRNAPTARNAPAAGTSGSNAPAPEPAPRDSTPGAAPTTESPSVSSANEAGGESNAAKQPSPSVNEPNGTGPDAAVTPPPVTAPAAPPPQATDNARFGALPESAPNTEAEDFSTTDESTPSAARLADPAESQTGRQAAVQQESVTIEQVQSYFQSQWQAIKPAVISETLSYEVQLSETGEVVGFSGLNEAAEAYRSSLLPADRPLVFPLELPPNSTDQSAGLTLQLDLLPDGQAQVFQ